MESTKSITPQPEEEITVKDLILKLQEWVRFLWKKWLAILICGSIGAGLGLAYSLTKKTVYTAELTFVLEDSKTSSLGAYAGLATQFGIDLGGATSSGVFSGDNILAFLKSRLMVEKTLLSPIPTGGKQKSLADYYIEVTELREAWDKDPLLKSVYFPVNPDRKKFTIKQDSVLKTLYEGIVKAHLAVTKPDRKLSFISVKCTTKDELFSKTFTERLVKEATDFYVQTKTKRSQVTVDKLQAKADSIELSLNRKTYSVAASQDLNRNAAKSMAGVNIEMAARDKVMLQTMYGEVIRNLELSRMAMAQETPIIQIVDTPILPLKKERFGKLKGLVLGGFIGGFLIVLFLILRRVYKEIMASS